MNFKITASYREYCRYTGVSAELERRGYGSSRPELASANRQNPQGAENPHNRPSNTTQGEFGAGFVVRTAALYVYP
jgi:hypothetical protein